MKTQTSTPLLQPYYVTNINYVLLQCRPYGAAKTPWMQLRFSTLWKFSCLSALTKGLRQVLSCVSLTKGLRQVLSCLSLTKGLRQVLSCVSLTKGLRQVLSCLSLTKGLLQVLSFWQYINLFIFRFALQFLIKCLSIEIHCFTWPVPIFQS